MLLNASNVVAWCRRSQWLQNFRTNQLVKGDTASRRAERRALDKLICTEARLAIAIDGFL